MYLVYFLFFLAFNQGEGKWAKLGLKISVFYVNCKMFEIKLVKINK